MLKFDEIILDKRFEKLAPYCKEQFKAMEQLALQDGEILQPLTLWTQEKTLLDSYISYAILKAHPELKYSIKEIEFKDWQEASVWAIEHHISKPTLSLWQKLELAIQCAGYWELKAAAKLAQGTRSDLMSATDKKSGKVDVTRIIAEKVGCGKTTVVQFKHILASKNNAIIKKCRNGDMSISAAYDSITGKKPKTKTGKKGQAPDKVMVTDDCDIFDECEKDTDVGKKNVKRPNGIPLDPQPIIEKIQKKKVSDGAIWVVLHRDSAAMQVVKKSIDQKTGTINIKVDNFNCKIVSVENGIAIFEADHINGGTEEFNPKEVAEFDAKDKLAS